MSRARAAESGLPAQYLSTFAWTSPDPEFGGISSIDLEPDGAGFYALSDRGGLMKGRLLRDDAGRVTGVDAGPLVRLDHPDGTKLLGQFAADSEGLALAPDGGVYVSFEGYNRVWYYPGPGAIPTRLKRPREFDGFYGNSGLESLAMDAEGALYTLPERSGRMNRPFPVFRYRNGVWDRPFDLPRDGDWQASGADFGPDGKFYVLERDYLGIFGFQSQVWRFTLTDGQPDGGELLLKSAPGQHDNLEGIAVWRDPDGVLRLTMVSDDNFRFFQRTEIVEYRVPG